MKVLVIGSGGREHALVWKIKQSPKIGKIYCAPGNAGINSIAEAVNIKADDVKRLLNFAKDNKIDFTVVGPEQPLALGIVDEFVKEGLKIFGPSQNAAKLETSKNFAKDFMKKYGIPTAKYESFTAETKSNAVLFAEKVNYPVVVKADGLAAGKGVVICNNLSELNETFSEFFEKRIFGKSGDSAVLEEYLTGKEASVFVICDGTDYVVLPPAQDHKKISDGEQGKNTGGMGSYAPAENIVTGEILEKVKYRIIEPVLRYMKQEGNPYNGCLYCGLMIDSNNDPFVIEFNARFGDPETQVVIPLINSDFLEMLLASAEGTISQYKLEISKSYYCSVVLASKGYPDKYETGKEIKGLNKVTGNCIVFHAGTKTEGDRVLSSGGRVLNVVGFSDNSLKDAIDTAYINAELIDFENKYYRKDIGLKGM
jgi:phosphoribosylamine--glycine ligase